MESISCFPDQESLALALTSVLKGNHRQVTILDREPIFWGTFPKEVVTCRLKNHVELKLLCKYGDSQFDHDAYGHRGGVAYEAEVYRKVLQPLRSTKTKFHGAHRDRQTGMMWITLEFLDGATHLNKTVDPAAMPLAARWIGQFHAINEQRLSSPKLSFLKSYDANYYMGWARRTKLFTEKLRRRFPWLVDLCERFIENAIPLLNAIPTVIHGEYYPENILFRDGIIYPVDWESAAIAAGEIDLACLLEGWPAEIVRECELEYQRSRWPHGWLADFERTLAAARIYTQFRWLGDRWVWTWNTSEDLLWRFEQLHSASERLGLV